jgi:uncharacterized protein
MPLQIQRLIRAAVPAAMDSRRPPARELGAETVIFGPRPGHRPSPLPPVDIYVGSERSQFRAELTLLWSIDKHRDPARLYRVHVMRDLEGFKRRLWLTGFTNYRFAIPSLAAGAGRAIYNDADQVYVSDPGELFDLPMNGAGYLSVSERDSSVMLIDCARMNEVWSRDEVRRRSRRTLEERAVAAGLWGPLDGAWNARDAEYRPGARGLVHFTALHTQPWRPFPEQFVYFDNPTDPLWPDLEAEAIARGFLPVHAGRPSQQWPSALAGSIKPARAGPGALNGEELGDLLGPRAPEAQRQRRVAVDFLDRVPDHDVPWVVDRLFRVFGAVDVRIDEPLAEGRGRYRRWLGFWRQQLDLASRRHPETGWTLRHRSAFGAAATVSGGPAQPGAIVVLTHRKPGHNQQARAVARRLAERTGRRLVSVSVTTGEVTLALRRLLRLGPPVELPDDAAVVVASAWACTRVARQLARRRPELRLVLSGRKAGAPPDSGGVLLQCAHFRLPPHPNRLATTLPLNGGEVEPTRDATAWQSWLDSNRRCALLIGGSSRSHVLSESGAAELARSVSRWAAGLGARLLVVTSRRSAEVSDAIEGALGEGDLLYRWRADDPANPYGLVLEHADELVVTGESESMLADAVSRGRRFLVWPLPARPGNPWQRLTAELADRAVRPRINRRGTIRPQQGITYLCARALERGWVLPPRDIDALLERLFAEDLATPFGQAAAGEYDPGDEFERVLDVVVQRLGLGASDEEIPGEGPGLAQGLRRRFV